MARMFFKTSGLYTRSSGHSKVTHSIGDLDLISRLLWDLEFGLRGNLNIIMESFRNCKLVDFSTCHMEC